MFDNRHYVIFSVSELLNINFNEVLETSAETVRKSIDETKALVKWEGEIEPICISILLTKDSTYTHSQILDIMSSREWSIETIF